LTSTPGSWKEASRPARPWRGWRTPGFRGRTGNTCSTCWTASHPAPAGWEERIFIHLARNTPPARFQAYGGGAVPAKSAFQLGLALYELALVDGQAVDQARRGVVEAAGAETAGIREQTQDALARGLVSPETLARLNERNGNEPTPP